MRVDTYRRQATTLPCRPADKQAMKLRPFGREFPTASFEWKRALPSSPRVWQQGVSVSQSILIENHSSFADERPVSEREEANDSSYLFLVKICTHTHIPSGLRVSDDTVTWGPDGNIRYSLQRPWVGCWSWCLTSATSA